MTEIERLIQLLSRLPGFGPRSARRAVLHLIKRRETVMQPLVQALSDAADAILVCSNSGNLDTVEPCTVCRDEDRDRGVVCVVEDVADLWALERTRSFKGQYHVLGGVLSALDNIGPKDLKIDKLIERAKNEKVKEIILANSATVDGQTTTHYLADQLNDCNVLLSRLAQGLPIGGELDFLDDGTITQALKARSQI